MDGYYTISDLTINTNYATVSSGTGFSINNIKNNQNNKMKESTKELYKLTFIKTVEMEYVFEVLAESLEDAKKLISDGVCASKEKVVSVDTELVSAEDSCGNEVEE